jgi:hypothetical protein
MPPTFLIFLGFIAYLGLLAVSAIISLIMLIIRAPKEQIKILCFTALTSFPILLCVGLILSILFVLPALLFGYIFYYLGIFYVTGIMILLFLVVVAIVALYHWYLSYRMIKNFVYKKPVEQGISNDKLYSLLAKKIVRYINGNSI